MKSALSIHTSLLVLLLLFSHFLSLSQSVLADDDTAMSGIGTGVGSSIATAPLGVIQRTMEQQVLATIPPTPPESAVPFLTSPSGNYTASLVRLSGASLNAGGYGDVDFCYVQIQDEESSAILWESQCRSVSSSGECSLVFDENAGLELLDGTSNPMWSTLSDSTSGSYPSIVELDEDGGMRVVDVTGNVVWSTAEAPMVANQSCGLQTTPAMSPPSAGPVSGGVSPALGQQPPPLTPPQLNGGFGGGLNQQAQPPSMGPSQPSNGGIIWQQQPPPQSAPESPSQLSNGGFGGQQQYPPPLQQPLQGGNINGGNLQGSSSGLGAAQPLVDNTPYDSGCTRKEGVFGIGLAVILLLFHGFGFW